MDFAEVPTDVPQPHEPGRTGAEVAEQAIQPFEGGCRSVAQGVPHERVERRRFDVGVGCVEGVLLRAVVCQEESLALNPVHPPRQPEPRLNAGVGGRTVPTDVVPLDPETVSEKVVTGPSDPPPRKDVKSHADERILAVEVEDPDIRLVHRTHRQPFRADRTPW